MEITKIYVVALSLLIDIICTACGNVAVSKNS